MYWVYISGENIAKETHQEGRLENTRGYKMHILGEHLGKETLGEKHGEHTVGCMRG